MSAKAWFFFYLAEIAAQAVLGWALIVLTIYTLGAL